MIPGIGYMIIAPSGAKLRVSRLDLRVWAENQGLCPGLPVPDVKLLRILPASRLLALSTMTEGPQWSDEDSRNWNRERKHHVPLQSFRILSVDVAPHRDPADVLKEAEQGLLDLIKSDDVGTQVAQRLQELRSQIRGVRRGLGQNDVPPLKRGPRGLKPSTREDGWGHTPKDASVEDLFREWAATEAGTDKHEQLFKQIMERGADQLQIHQLLGQIHSLKGDITQLKAGQQVHRQHFTQMEQFILEKLEELKQGNPPAQKAKTSTVRVRCPHPDHEDARPSCDLDLETMTWFCWGCERSGSLVAVQAAPIAPAPADHTVPPPGVVFTPSPIQEVDLVFKQAAACDGTPERDEPRIRFEESCPDEELH